MKTPSDGGAAFPVSHQSFGGGVYLEPKSEGMTLRDWFAGMALQSIAATTLVAAAKRYEEPDHAKTALTEACYAIAYSMIQARQTP